MSASSAYDALELYPLRSLATVLPAYRPPEGAFDPAGAWRQSYGVYTLASRVGASARRVGSLTVARAPGEGGEATWNVAYDKALTGGRQVVRAELRGRGDDLLAAPLRWSFRIRIERPGGGVVPHTAVTGRGALRDGFVEIDYGGGGRRRLAVSGRYTVGWCLFDAVQRLQAGRKAVEFLLVDHFDQPKPETLLSPRGKMAVPVAGGRRVAVTAWEQLGRGNVPWVYWVDESGRLLWVVAGLEGYALERSVAGR